MGVRSTNPTQSFFDDFFRSGTDAVNSFTSPSGIIASGGVINDYEVSGTYYISCFYNIWIISCKQNINKSISR